MTQDIPTIRMFMTMAPYAVGRERTVAFAKSIMKQHGVRHLPVIDAQGEVIGVLSERALKLIERRWDLDDGMLHVETLTHHDVFTVAPETPVNDVCATMAERRYGCAIVVQDKRPIGIFTTTDACAALASLFQTRSA
jgi:acetoin utilization protein AcuB